MQDISRRDAKWDKCKHGLGRSCYLLERTLCPDALPSYKDPIIPEAQSLDNRAAQIRDEMPGFIVEPTIKKTKQNKKKHNKADVISSSYVKPHT